ncbi:MAG: hypothetical protein A2Z66_04350 [Chloroflexi bacterium RBG_13_66_10]|nr:MAG: hypothetical protein A2Z66_04350 [Chloroflexi bacterium RBG_13_66_10]
MHRSNLGIPILLILGLLTAAPAFAQGGLEVTVGTEIDCQTASFTVTAAGGSTYNLEWDFGDGEALSEAAVASPWTTAHTYPGSGVYNWSVLVTEATDPALSALAAGTLTIGPSVTLQSQPFPPLLTLEAGQASADFQALAEGGGEPYAFDWDLDGDGITDPDADPSLSTSSFTYTAPGHYTASVTVTDSCGLAATDSLPVVVIDPETTCHPMAARIAEAVSLLFPDQAEQLYTCEDIFDFFTGGLTGGQLGFGRMWHAYNLTQTLDDLTWEEILDWHLEGNGWGLLLQLDRFSEELADVDLGELMMMVMDGEASVADIRTAVRAASRYDADFEDALARLADGANPGELSQIYRTAQQLQITPETLDGYLEAGISAVELRHAARLADQIGGDWAELAQAHASGLSWGEIHQASRLTDDETGLEEILSTGVQEFREQQREQDRAQQHQEQTLRTAERLAERFGVSVDSVMGLFNGACEGDWGCVRGQLAGQSQPERDHPGRGGGRP